MMGVPFLLRFGKVAHAEEEIRDIREMIFRNGPARHRVISARTHAREESSEKSNMHRWLGYPRNVPSRTSQRSVPFQMMGVPFLAFLALQEISPAMDRPGIE
jgi:hypothetical protein